MSAATRAPGSGTLITSGSTVMGSGTLFSKEVAVGDAIEVTHPKTGVTEIRIVKMVLSNVSMGLNSAFTSDLATPVPYHVLKLPKAIVTPEMAAAAASKSKVDEEKSAYGRYGADASGKTFTYRERLSGGSYRVRSVATERSMTREELLDMRAKVKSDKFC
jgi:hypothetical protein